MFCNENVILNRTLRKIVCCDNTMLVMLYNISDVYFRLLGTNGFHVHAMNERFAPED